MIPRLEWSTLLTTLFAARAMAFEGRVAAGYTRLSEGLHHAEALARRGHPFGRRLVNRYRKAIEEYIARFGVYYERDSGETHHPVHRSDETHPGASPSSREGGRARASLFDTHGKATEEGTEG
jgi:hypothetical protein